MKIEYRNISPNETEAINQISDWYLSEWKISKIKTTKSLTESTNQNVIFQTIMTDEKKLIGTGGLYHKVGIQSRIKKYENYSPWIALMFTEPKIRGKGLGSKLLDEIELEAKKKGFEKIYLFTHTAESLYIRKGWNEIDRYQIEGKNIVIMDKEI
ncbi:GNAT family N-acetyltransferase [Aurantibacter crassamenti]|uniref:GNAT family N-acetyltransferase n=1 Tax=Aurantibacter crassamenti TaxID=1837375 RepID=UPI00193A6864|nr:GNAT family N-acetyltransferase [Aurantibacter crassamenti]MBM1106384.1 GNAT family N-acetyltransferase [Aurantibacter crassamenti]